jgi:hypothetical protein
MDELYSSCVHFTYTTVGSFSLNFIFTETKLQPLSQNKTSKYNWLGEEPFGAF